MKMHKYKLKGKLEGISPKMLILGLLMQRCPYCYKQLDIPISAESLSISCKCGWAMVILFEPAGTSSL